MMQRRLQVWMGSTSMSSGNPGSIRASACIIFLPFRSDSRHFAKVRLVRPFAHGSKLVLGGSDAFGSQIHLRRRAVMRGVVEHEHQQLETGHRGTEARIALLDLR